MKLIKWIDRRDILMICTKPFNATALVDIRKTSSTGERITKSQVVLDYNEERHGTDFSNPLSVYYTCLRQFLKWYQKVTFELMFGTVVANSYLIYKQNYARNNISVLQFRKSLVRSLLLDNPFENRKPGLRQQSTSYLKCKALDNKLQEMKDLHTISDDDVSDVMRKTESKNSVLIVKFVFA